MSLRLKGRSFARQVQSQVHEQTSNQLTPFGFALLACETCVLEYLASEGRKVNEEQFYDHFKRMRWTYPKKLYEFLSENSVDCREDEKYRYDFMEGIVKGLDPRHTYKMHDTAILKALKVSKSAAIEDVMLGLMHQYFLNARAWSLGVALTFLDPKIRGVAWLLQSIRQCKKLNVGKDFNIYYPAVLDKEVYDTLKEWWDFVEDLGRSESKDRLKKSKKVLLSKEEKSKWFKYRRRCDFIEWRILTDDLPRYQLAFELSEKWPLNKNDPADKALLKKCFRAFARHALDDDISVKELLQDLEKDFMKKQKETNNKVELAVARIKLAVSQSIGDWLKGPEEWAPIALKRLLEGVARKCDPSITNDQFDISKLLSKARAAVDSASLKSDFKEYLMGICNEVEKFARTKGFIEASTPISLPVDLIDLSDPTPTITEDFYLSL